MLKNNFFCRGLSLGLFLALSLFSVFQTRAADERSVCEKHLLLPPPQPDENLSESIEKIKKISMASEPNLVSWKILYEDRGKACEEIKKILDKVSDEDIFKLVGYYGASFDLLMNVLATAAFTHYYTGVTDAFSVTIHDAWDKIENFDTSVGMPVMLVVKELDDYIKKSKTIGGQRAGFSLVDMGILVQNAIQRGKVFKAFFRVLFFLENSLFSQIQVPTEDADLKFCGMTSFAKVWERIYKVLIAHDQVFSSDGTIFSLLEIIKQNSNILLFLGEGSSFSVLELVKQNFDFLSSDKTTRILNLASRPSRFSKRLGEIKTFLKNSPSENGDKIINQATEFIEGLELCLLEFNRGNVLGAKLDPIFFNLMSHFFDTGHITILYLSAIFDVLKTRISGMVEGGEKPQCTEALLDVKKYQRKLDLFLTFLSKKAVEDKVGGKKKKCKEKIDIDKKLEGFEELVKDSDFWNFPDKIAEKKARMCGFEYSTERFWVSFKFSLAPFVEWIRKRQRQNNMTMQENKDNKKSGKRKQKQAGDGLKKIARLTCKAEYLLKWYGNEKMVYSLPCWYQSLIGARFITPILFPQRKCSIEGDNYPAIVDQVNKNIPNSTQKKQYRDPFAAVGFEVLRFAAERNKKSGEKTYRILRVADLRDDLKKALNLSEKMSGDLILLCPGFLVVHRGQDERAVDMWKMVNERNSVANMSQMLASLIFNNVAPKDIKIGLFFARIGQGEDGQKIEKETKNLELKDAGFCEYRAPFGCLSKNDYPKDVLNSVGVNSFYDNTELSLKYKKNLKKLSASELQVVYNYLANCFRFHLMFVSYEEFVRFSLVQKKYENFKYPYFGVLDTIATSLLKERENMSEAVRICIDAFDADEFELMGYSVMDLLKLHKLRCEKKRAFSNMIGFKKRLEELLYPEGHEHERTLPISDEERDLRNRMFKTLFGKDSYDDNFFVTEGKVLSKSSANFAPMKDLYKQVFLTLEKFPFLCNSRMFIAILGGLFDGKTKNFFIRNSDCWLYSNRKFDMRGLSFIPKENHNVIDEKWKELRRLMRIQLSSAKMAKKFKTEVFVKNFCGHLPPLINLYSTLIDLTGERIDGESIKGLSPYGLVMRCLFSCSQHNDAALFFQKTAQLIWTGDDFGKGIIPPDVEKTFSSKERHLVRGKLLLPFFTVLKNESLQNGLENKDKKISFRSIIAEIPSPLPIIEKK